MGLGVGLSFGLRLYILCVSILLRFRGSLHVLTVSLTVVKTVVN